MINVSHRRLHGRSRHRRDAVKINAATALLITRAAWRMYRGRWPWSAATQRRKAGWRLGR